MRLNEFDLDVIASVMKDKVTCSYCESELSINNGLNVITCSNPKCKLKLAYRLQTFLEQLCNTEIHISELVSFINECNIKSIDDILYIDGCDNYLLDRIIKELQETDYDFELDRVIKALDLEYLEGITEKLFMGYTNIGEFYTDLHQYDIVHVNTRLNYKHEEIVLLPKIVKSLLDNQEEVERVCDRLNILNSDFGIVRVTIDKPNIEKDIIILSQLSKYIKKSIIVTNKLYRNTDLLISSQTESDVYQQYRGCNMSCKVISTVTDAIVYLNEMYMNK